MRCGFSEFQRVCSINGISQNEEDFNKFFGTIPEFIPIVNNQICNLKTFYQRYIYDYIYNKKIGFSLKFLVILEKGEKKEDIKPITMNKKEIISFLVVTEEEFHEKLTPEE